MKEREDLEVRNLICLYGPSGSGKTRFLQAMENALSSEGVLRTGVESIIWEMVATHSYAGMTVFRQKYLGLENLLIDNLWVLEKKPATTAEICRLIRNRQKVGKLTVVASDISEQQWAARNCEVAQLLASGQSVRLGGPVSL